MRRPLTTSSILALGVLAFASRPASAQQQGLDRVRDLYSQASYEDALGVLSKLDGGYSATDAARYRAACLLALGRSEDARREATMAMTLRPNEPLILYNADCTFCLMDLKAEAMDAIGKAWRAGWRDADWAWRDPDLGILHEEPEFKRLFPEPGVES